MRAVVVTLDLPPLVTSDLSSAFIDILPRCDGPDVCVLLKLVAGRQLQLVRKAEMS